MAGGTGLCSSSWSTLVGSRRLFGLLVKGGGPGFFWYSGIAWVVSSVVCRATWCFCVRKVRFSVISEVGGLRGWIVEC